MPAEALMEKRLALPATCPRTTLARISCSLLALREFATRRPTSRARLSDAGPERAAAREGRIFRGGVRSAFSASQEDSARVFRSSRHK